MQHRSRILIFASAVVTCGALCSACGGAGPAAGQSTAPMASPSGYAAGAERPEASGKATTGLKTATVDGRRVVVDADGLPVYFYTEDKRGESKSVCLGGCATLWPAVTSAQQPTAEGITAQVGSIPAADGGKQITLNGLPIYYYAKDTAAGQASGQGVAGVWYLVAPDGSMVTAGAASGTGTASPSATP
ncbi:hypothetical protein [Sinomonas atrocyanea]|jgi:predicted lipoprotein with Yx(FWY)xxD motif|uniref:COG4315 family predicted lipoprotein n=1 Tax=Sinomonas atrocyanea TaxID=37927 RepID=UPI0027817B4F|nr:hypothetical protein [Sinomonas atrocyanea]MDQ0260721.1 putative lipoprotein with Yx(FWY)xxD motif [Sinomonas atrocyanea]MDR6622296.1 putative lipoprotein with Yx(FWY)xxD motif [Sinomonas atrocyanea]